MRKRYWDITFFFSLICSLLINSGMVGLVVLHTQPPTGAELRNWQNRPAMARAMAKPAALAQVAPVPAAQPVAEQAKEPPKPKIEFDDRDAFGENGGIGEALNSNPGEQPMESTKGPQVQAFLGRTASLSGGGGGGSAGAGGATMIGAVSPAAAATPIVKALPVPVKVPPPPPQHTETAAKPQPEKPKPSPAIAKAPPTPQQPPAKIAANPQIAKVTPADAAAKPTVEKPRPKTDKPAGKELADGEDEPADETGSQIVRPPPSAPPPVAVPPQSVAASQPAPDVVALTDAPSKPAVAPIQLASAMQPNQPSQPSKPGRPGTPGPPNASPDQAPASDKDSDPFSDSNSFRFVNGKVSARNGRWVKTVKPQLTQAGWIDASMMANPTVTFLATVDDQGNVINVARYRSSGSDNIDLPCEQALNEWKIEPSKDKNGKPVRDVVAVSFGFQ